MLSYWLRVAGMMEKRLFLHRNNNTAHIDFIGVDTKCQSGGH